MQPDTGTTRARDPLAALAAAAAAAPDGPQPGTRLRTLKGLVLRAARVVTGPQARFNHEVLQVLDGLVQGAGQLRVQLEDLARRADERDHRLAELSAHLGPVDLPPALAQRVEDLRAASARDRAELQALRARTEVVTSALRQSAAPAVAAGADRALRGRLDRFYADFEHLFRGGATEIRGRLAVHLDDVLAAPDGGPVLDLGAGRAEWLEMLGERGVDAYGVDLNGAFVADAVRRGLRVLEVDAVAHLATVAPASLRAVTAFHLVEHVPFATLIDLVDGALSALCPGGVLVLETPNPDNLRVGATTFWIDPTHLRPLHPDLLRFVVSSRGFTDVRLRLLHPDDDGPRDYAVVACRPQDDA